VSRTRIVNGVQYRWTRKGWEAMPGRGKPVHWSEVHKPGLKPATGPADPEDDEEGQGGGVS
jgi:hypothetical protein